MRRIILIMTLVICMFTTVGCVELGEIESIEDVKGKRIGVLMGYGTDYYLTKLGESKIIRYNENQKMFLDLASGRLDAATGYGVLMPKVLAEFPDVFKIIPGGYVYENFIMYMAEGREEFQDAYSQFMEVFRESDEYKDILQRYEQASERDNYDPLSGYSKLIKYVEPTGTGKTFTVACAVDCEPYVQYDFVNDRIIGFEVEILTHFANYMNYTLVIENHSWTSACYAVEYGVVDAMLGEVSDLFKADAEEAGLLCSAPHLTVESVLVVKNK